MFPPLRPSSIATCGRFFTAALWLSGLNLPGVAVAQEAEEEPPPASAPAAPVEAELSPAALFSDFMHYARLGKFQEARAFAAKLLAHPDLDPVQLLEQADKDRKSFETLVTVINNSSIGEEAKRVLEVLRQGEGRKRQVPERINLNIQKLGGTPQTEYNAIQLLTVSGEYAVPWMVQAMIDPAKETLRPRIVRALPKLGAPAVTPLTVALETSDRDAKQNLIRVLGEIGYAHASPYLKKLAASPDTPEDIRAIALEAVRSIERRLGRSLPGSAAQEFVELGEQYYREQGSVQADSRVATANVWYWRDNFVTAIPVPREIFGSIMAMRCAEEALRLEPAREDAIALWLAANIRREARMGMDVESGEAVQDAVDNTRPEGFPRTLFFSRAAGARYCQSVLERAIADRDAKVALGAIAALRAIAGEANLVGSQETQPPLSKALTFADSLVRIKAALALGEARPKSQFAGSEWVVPVLAEALSQSGRPAYLVIEPNETNLNRVMEILRAAGAEVLGDADFFRAMERGRKEFKTITGMYISTTITAPGVGRGVEELRREFLFAMTPVVLLEAATDRETVKSLESRDPRVAHVAANATEQEIADAMAELMNKSGRTALDPESSLKLALEAADVLLGLARDGRTAFNVDAAEPTLITVLEQAADEGLRIRVAAALSYGRSQASQRALASLAFDDKQSETLRISVFAAMAESAKQSGNLLSEGQVARLVEITADESKLALRTAASQALGALNLSDNKASDLIRKYYRG